MTRRIKPQAFCLSESISRDDLGQYQPGVGLRYYLYPNYERVCIFSCDIGLVL